MEYDDTNRGVLFKNDKKSASKQPDFKGKIDVNGEEYWLSAWTYKNKDGSFKLLSLAVSPKDYVKQEDPQEDNGDIPF